jgi:hypothetical protein
MEDIQGTLLVDMQLEDFMHPIITAARWDGAPNGCGIVFEISRLRSASVDRPAVLDDRLPAFCAPDRRWSNGRKNAVARLGEGAKVLAYADRRRTPGLESVRDLMKKIVCV